MQYFATQIFNRGLKNDNITKHFAFLGCIRYNVTHNIYYAIFKFIYLNNKTAQEFP